MGTCYTLIRRDRRIGYDLGKAWELHHVFSSEASSYGSAQPPSMIVTPADIETLAELMAMAMRGDFDEPLTLSLARDHDYEYWHQVAADIVDWSEGQPFEFHSEHSGLVEDYSMEGWDERPRIRRFWETGDRHNPADEHRDKLARRRREDEAFRTGNVWTLWDPANRREVELVRTAPSAC